MAKLATVGDTVWPEQDADITIKFGLLTLAGTTWCAVLSVHGRRVFKTEDGTQVFDEFGVEVSADELDPELIGSNRPTYEAYAADVDALAGLEAERTQILEFQDQVDAAREQIADGEISDAELDGLDADLLGAMPPTVRSHVAGLEATKPQAFHTTQVSNPSTAPTRHAQSVETTSPAPAPFQ